MLSKPRYNFLISPESEGSEFIDVYTYSKDTYFHLSSWRCSRLALVQVQHIVLTDWSFQATLLDKVSEGLWMVSNSKGEELFAVSPSSAWKGCKIKWPTARESSLMVVCWTSGGLAGELEEGVGTNKPSGSSAAFVWVAQQEVDKTEDSHKMQFWCFMDCSCLNLYTLNMFV